MKETVIQIRTEAEKIEALRIFLSEKDGSIEAELADCIDVLYKKHVPAPVREYIEKTDIRGKESGEEKHRRVATKKPLCDDSTKNG